MECTILPRSQSAIGLYNGRLEQFQSEHQRMSGNQNPK